VVDSVEQILVVIYCDSQSTIYTYSLVIIGGIMNESGNELQFVQLDADWVRLAEKVLVKQGMSVGEYLTAALKRVYVSDELPFDPELSYDEEKRLLVDEEFDYQNEHGIDLTQEQKLADWWADTAEDYE
jgi:antitoxin component of RelBE/YafQ-DinJ toxin-antitoxin module